MDGPGAGQRDGQRPVMQVQAVGLQVHPVVGGCVETVGTGPCPPVGAGSGPVDRWADTATFQCRTCFYYVARTPGLGRCRRHAPGSGGAGFPVMYADDFCGDHKLAR